MNKENVIADYKGFETASQQIHRERAARRKKRTVRQRKKMQLLARRRGIRTERTANEAMKSASIVKRIRWWFIKVWRKLFLTR